MHIAQAEKSKNVQIETYMAYSVTRLLTIQEQNKNIYNVILDM